jgi:hypothetical protein
VPIGAENSLKPTGFQIGWPIGVIFTPFKGGGAADTWTAGEITKATLITNRRANRKTFKPAMLISFDLQTYSCEIRI